VFSRRILGWAPTTHLRTELPPEALQMAIWARGHHRLDQLVHHTDRGSTQYLSVRYTETLASAGALGSVGSRGDSYDNALCESTIGQIKAELVHRCGPWCTVEQLEFALFEYFDWWNHRQAPWRARDDHADRTRACLLRSTTGADRGRFPMKPACTEPRAIHYGQPVKQRTASTAHV
jgi:putative transposase